MCFIYGRFVEGNDGKMYTKAFDKERNDIEVINLQKCMSRPLFSVSYPITSLDKVNIRFSVFEMEIDRMLGSNSGSNSGSNYGNSLGESRVDSLPRTLEADST